MTSRSRLGLIRFKNAFTWVQRLQHEFELYEYLCLSAKRYYTLCPYEYRVVLLRHNVSMTRVRLTLGYLRDTTTYFLSTHTIEQKRILLIHMICSSNAALDVLSCCCTIRSEHISQFFQDALDGAHSLISNLNRPTPHTASQRNP